MEYLKQIISEIECNYLKMQNCDAVNTIDWIDSIQNFRHREKNPTLFVFLKGIRCVSLLNASLVLLEKGFLQEMGIFFRCLDESIEDICLFIPDLVAKNDCTKTIQKEMLEDFYQEEFEDISVPLLKNNKRNTIRRKNVRATNARNLYNPIDVYNHAQINQTIYNMNSGYVHGAYPHIMELYNSCICPNYNTSGITHSLRIQENKHELLRHVYSLTLVAKNIAIILDNPYLSEEFSNTQKNIEDTEPQFKANNTETFKSLGIIKNDASSS